MKIAGCQESTTEVEPGSYFAPQFIIVASLYIDQLNITTTYVFRRGSGGGGVQERANEVNIINHVSGW
jgi:hypothetical protein